MNTVKTLLYMCVMHGLFTFYLPYQLAIFEAAFFNVGIFKYLALPLWLLGTGIIIWCSIDIILKGLGTPAHLDPPKKLIVNGLYRYTRNPIYLGSLLIVLGFIAWSGSRLVILYFLFFTLAYNILIIFIEEPILRNMFGAEYEEYCKHVPRWLPRYNKR